MNSIKNTTNNINTTDGNETEEYKSELSNEAVTLVTDLFKFFSTHVSYFMLNHGKNLKEFNETKREWVKTFQIRQTTAEQIKKGVENIRKQEDPITNLTPAQFLKMCKPTAEDIGAPTLERAYDQACRMAHPCETVKKWDHEAVRLASQATGSHFLRNESKTKTFPVFEKNYLKAVDDFAAGRNLNQIEQKGRDTPTNRHAYQYYHGDVSNPVSYPEWLKTLAVE